MASVFRYLVTVALATIITLAAFYLMHRLIDGDSAEPVSQPSVTSIRFGPVDIPEPPKPKELTPPEKPEPQEPPPSSTVVAEIQPIDRPRDFDLTSTPTPDSVGVRQATFGNPSQGSSGNARPVAAVPPPYPPEAARDGIEGWVRVSIEIDATGRVGDVRVLDAEPRGVFEKTAVRTVRRWSWKPAVIDGEPRAQRVVQELTFTLDDD